MRTMRLSLAAIATLMTAAVLGGAVVAQDDATIGAFTPVTGQRLSATAEDSGAMGWHDLDNWYLSGLDAHGTYEWSDPRLPAESVGVVSVGMYSGQEIDWFGQYYVGQWLFEGDGGHWTGTVHGYFDDEQIGRASLLLNGHGAYDGLTAILRGTTHDPACPWCLTYEGAIFEGAVPTMPAPLEPAVE